MEIDDVGEDKPEPNFVDDDCYDLTRSEPWLSKEHPEIAEWLKGHKPTIETLLRATKKQKCGFPIYANVLDLGKSTDRLASIRHWAYLLIRAANNDLGDSRVDQAIEKLNALLQMAKHQYQQLTIIEHLVGLSIEALATKQLNKFVITANPTNAHLNIIEKALANINHDWSSDWLRMLECEKLMMKSFLSLIYEINPKGKVRLSRDPTAIVRSQFPEKMPSPTYWQTKLTKAGTILGWFFMPSTPQKAGEIIDASYEKLCKMADPDFDWTSKPSIPSITSIKFNYFYLTKHLTSLLEGPYHKIHDLYLRINTEQMGSRVIIALRRYKNRYGNWPETLEDIKPLAPAKVFVDPFNNGPFVYKLTEEKFTLYSRGKNNIDEAGRYKRAADEEHKPDDWPIWPPAGKKRTTKSSQTKQDIENANNQ